MLLILTTLRALYLPTKILILNSNSKNKLNSAQQNTKIKIPTYIHYLKSRRLCKYVPAKAKRLRSQHYVFPSEPYVYVKFK